LDFHYDGQVRRYLLQFMRVFSSIKIRNGPDANGMYSVNRVPILYGDPSNIVAQIIKGGSENTILPAPMFSAYIDGIKMSPGRRQDTQYVGKVSTVERKMVDGQYTNEPGVRYDVERYMPVPYDITFKLDCWTTNTTTKLQIMEQINMFFNPSIQLQQNSNILDWTSIFEIWMKDFTWTNRSIPQGSEIERDVMSWKFEVPVWINPPAKVKKSALIAEIVTNIFYTSEFESIEKSLAAGDYDPFRECIDGVPTQLITTEGNYQVVVQQENGIDTVTLLAADGTGVPAQDWQKLIKIYGQITPNITKMRLKLDPDIDVDTTDIIGTIEQDINRPNVLYFTPDIDTLPGNTILPINAIIDPVKVQPGNGLPAAAPGQRYLLASGFSAGEEPALPPAVSTSPWGVNLIAYPNDIIEYNSNSWNVIFDSQNATGLNYVVNSANNSQYTFDGENWSYTYYGKYPPGYWRIDNITKADTDGDDTDGDDCSC
jgi:hypothetical protein